MVVELKFEDGTSKNVPLKGEFSEKLLRSFYMSEEATRKVYGKAVVDIEIKEK